MTASSSSAPMVSLGRSFRGDKTGRIAAHDAGEVPLQAHEVLVDIVASGLCGTDLHYRKASIGLGHEGVGVVSQVGGNVDSFKKGDRVGWGYVHGADLTCDSCIRGVDTLCPNRKMFGASNTAQGSLGDHYVINAQFLHRIPDNLLLKHAAPLQCAGATVLSAIINSGAQPWDRVGVVGLGGLGHLALQYLAKMGCDVVAFSGSNSKRDEAMRLGAREFVAAKDGGLEKLAKPVKFLFVSTSVQPDWDAYTSEKVMASRGTVVPLSVSPEPFQLKSYQSIISRELRIMGSVVASRPLHRQMIEFSARHGIQPIIEELPMTEEGVNEAADRLEKGDVRYRFVLINSKHADPLDKSSK